MASAYTTCDECPLHIEGGIVDQFNSMSAEIRSLREERDRLREALDCAIKERMAQDDEVVMGYLEKLHDAKSIIRLLVKVL